MRILLDDTPLHTGHAGRGIGAYTRLLAEALTQTNAMTIEPAAWKEHWRDADLVHFPYFDLFFATLPRLKKPVVVTIHDVIPLQFPKQYPVGQRGKLNFWRQKRALRSAEAIITDSQSSKDAIVQYLQLPPNKIRVIPLAADPHLTPPDPATLTRVRRAYQLPSQYLLYVGDINYNKNLPQLIKALKYLDDAIHLVLVGRNFRPQDIPEWRAIETQIALSDVAARVLFLPDLATGDTRALASLYANALCYVQPSLAEGFGLPVLEALQVGVPVIASNRTSLPEVGGHAVYYCEPTAEAIATAVDDVAVYPPDKRQLIIDEGRRHAATFSWQRVAKETMLVYLSVLKTA